MTTVQRGTARREGVIEADVGNLWALLTDRGNLDWWGNDSRKGASRRDAPTWRGKRQSSAYEGYRALQRGEPGLVHVNREVLIHEDPVIHRLYYTGSDGLLLGVRNYLASWTLDMLDGARCRMTITSNFDVLEPGNVDFVRDTLEAVYDLIFKGAQRLFGSAGLQVRSGGLKRYACQHGRSCWRQRYDLSAAGRRADLASGLTGRGDQASTFRMRAIALSLAGEDS